MFRARGRECRAFTDGDANGGDANNGYSADAPPATTALGIASTSNSGAEWRRRGRSQGSLLLVVACRRGASNDDAAAVSSSAAAAAARIRRPLP